jgi:hypothetical protein
LIVIIELVKFGIGFYLGKNALPVFSTNSLSIIVLLISVSVFVAQNYFKEKLTTATHKTAFGITLKGNLLIFATSFLLSILVGNQWGRFSNPTTNANISAKLVEEKPVKINIDSLLSVVKKEQFAKQIQTTEPEEKENDGLQRLGYFALFLASLLLTYFAGILACLLACSGYGVIAVMALLLGIGILGGGVYFLLKVFRNGGIKKWREMDKSERKKERKRYFFSILIALGVLVSFLITANLLG